MIDDIVEGAEFIRRREELPPRMCVYGASYGAFAAASAVFRYPDYFKCAAGHVGVYDLPEMFVSGDIPESKAGKAFLRRVLALMSKNYVRTHRASMPTKFVSPCC